MKKAVILLSGGLDSATILYMAKAQKYAPHCLVVNYGQRHSKEIVAAKRIAKAAKAPCVTIDIDMPWKGSSLLDRHKKLPQHLTIDPTKIPSTYVPARNIIFLSFAVSYAEAIGAAAVFIGANAIDYSGYPDCRPEFFKAYQETLRRGLKTGVEGHPIQIIAPLVKMTKAQIIKQGLKLGVPYQLTWSCYQGGKKPCGTCDSCRLRAKGFAEAKVSDLIS